MLSLNIHHNIHLTKQQIYNLHEGKDIIVVGVSIPVWFIKDKKSKKNDLIHKSNTEPAKEIFCNYYLKNPKKELPIKIMEDGYEITIPFREAEELNITNKKWRKLKLNRSHKLDSMYNSMIQEMSSKNLLEIKEGGSSSLQYREHNKVNYKGEILNILHFISIHSTEHLIDSISTV